MCSGKMGILTVGATMPNSPRPLLAALLIAIGCASKGQDTTTEDSAPPAADILLVVDQSRSMSANIIALADALGELDASVPATWQMALTSASVHSEVADAGLLLGGPDHWGTVQ